MSTTNFNWSTPSTLSSLSDNATNPLITIDPKGNIDALWIENALLKASSKSVNGTWTATTTLSNVSSSSPCMVMDNNGNTTAIWVQNNIVTVSSKTLNGSWLTATSLSSPNASSPTIAVDNGGNLVAAWVRLGNIESSTKLFGSTWQNSVTISSTSASSPHIAIGGSTNTIAVIVWHSTSTNLVYASNKTLNGNWTTEQIISDPTHTSAYAKIAIDNNSNAIAIWSIYNLTGSLYSNIIIQASCRSYSANKWNAISNLSSVGIYNPANLNKCINIDKNGNAIALWSTSFDGSTFNVQYSIKPVNNIWSPATDIVNSLYSFAFDSGIVSLGNVLLAFMFYNGRSLVILTSEINLSGYKTFEWSVPINVSTGSSNSLPHIVASISNNTINAAVAWINFNGSKNIIQVSTGSQSLVLPPSNLTIVQNTNNLGLFTEYYNELRWTESTDSNLEGYIIFRNGMFLDQINSNTTNYVDNNQTQNGTVTYGVAAIDNQQSQSNIIIANFP